MRFSLQKTVTFLFAFVFLGVTLCSVSACQKEQKVATRYEINVEYVPTSYTLAGTEKVTYENKTDGEISTLKFQLYPNAYRENALYSPIPSANKNEAYYAGESYGEMVVSSVNGAKAWEVMGEDENILCAELERSLFPGDKVVLDIGFLVKLAKVNHRTGITENTVNFGNCFPILCGSKNGGFSECLYYAEGDPFVSECADFTVNITLPKDYIIAATGKIEERALESKKVYTVSALNVRDFAFVASDKFRVEQKTLGNVQLSYYYVADKKPLETLAVAAESFAYFQETFGEYPYAAYSIAETGLCGGGAEYPCLTMLAENLDDKERVRALVHETAHQWWYAVVGSDQIENAWQDEGLAEYSALTFFEKYEKYGITREDEVCKALEEYRSYYDVYGSVLNRTDTAMVRHLKDFVSGYEYKCLEYDKPVVMFDTLRKSVGDKKFFASLRRYYKENAYLVAPSGALIGAFEKNGLDVGGFFESFLHGKAIL